jgi:hypothetical protein
VIGSSFKKKSSYDRSAERRPGCVNPSWPHIDGGIWLQGAEITGCLRLASL